MDSPKKTAYTFLRADIISLITIKPKLVLDVGCSNGVFLEFAKKKLGANFTTGIECDHELIHEARQKADEIVEADLDYLDVGVLGERRFDLIVLADVLEHTKDPVSVLREVLKAATENAEIIISLPNIQHWTAIKNLIGGVWPQRERGLFDKTHLRFFTLRSIVDLAAECGLQIESMHRNYRILDAMTSRINRFSHVLGFWPFAPYFTYQYVVRLRRVVRPD